MEAALIDRLRAGLPGAGVDWGASPQGISVPRVVLTQAWSAPEYEHGAATDLWSARVQIDCYAIGSDAVMALAGQVLALISGWVDRPAGILGCFVIAVRDFGTEAIGVEDVSRRIIEAKIHYREA